MAKRNDRYTEEWLNEYMQKFSVDTARAAADMEPRTCYAPLAKKKTARFNRPVSIRMHQIRNRLTDSDGACVKYVLDAIVSAGVLCDDSPEQIPESPAETQEKRPGQEYTEIEIVETDG